MIEVLLQDCGNYRWFLICESGRVLVLGALFACDKLANQAAKVYRTEFRLRAAAVDDYDQYGR